MVSTTDDFVNGGIIATAVLAILLVALSTYGRRRRRPAIRFLVWGASTLFLPLTSSIISSLLDRSSPARNNCAPPLTGKDNPDIQNMWTLLLWVVLILTIKSNADVAAATVAAAAASPGGGDDGVVDGQRIKPPVVEHLTTYAWLGFLILHCIPLAGWLGPLNIAVFVAFSALGLVKLALKLAAFWSAADSFALGKNARLVAGYMAQLVRDGDGDGQVPRYIVIGETKKHVEETALGYRVKSDVLADKLSSLVTLDRVWRLAERGGGILAQRQELRDLCLSYSLFKLLRRRLSGYPLADAGSGEALDFVLRGMDSAGGAGINADRMFRILVDELWFASDFYYSTIPLCTFGGWSATLNYLCSVLLIIGAIAVGWIYQVKDVVHSTPYKIITFSLLLAVVLVEAWEIVAGVCSNWTKMALLGHYMRQESAWHRSGCVRAALTAALRLRPATRWRHKIGQHSLLEPRRFLKRSGLPSEKLYGKEGLVRSIELSPAVKDAVVRSLLSSYGRMNKGGGGAAARRVGATVDWTLYGNSRKSWAWTEDGSSSNTELILTWHVATRLVEMKSTSASPDMIAASHLSNYFAYLVAAAPELLPDGTEWSKKRYKEVSADVRAALGADNDGDTAAGRYDGLVAVLSDESRDAVLRRGAELGRHLATQYADDEASACRILADFWSEMALYVAPSENVKGHVQAMARGGEFITLVWALLLHAGVTTRPDMPPSAIP